VLEGEIEIDGDRLATRDAIGVTDAAEVDIEAVRDSRLLLIEVPMH
jgi:hypothetical protein